MSDRKYRQRDYRSDDASKGGEKPARTERPPAGPRPRTAPDRHERPRGRGLGAPTEAVFRCSRCGHAAPVASVMAEGASCVSCGADLRTCTNCANFDSGARFECRAAIPARVSPKDRTNTCELFDPRLRQEFAQEKPSAKGDRAGDARSAFDALFKI